MFDLPAIAPPVAFLAFWMLVGICPPDWPWRKLPPFPPPPPPPWSRLVGLAGAVLVAGTFTSIVGGGVGPGSSPLVEFAATGVLAYVGAVASRVLVAQFAPAGQTAAVRSGTAVHQ